MIPTWLYTARRHLLGTLAWGLVLFAMGMLILISFDYVVHQNKDLLIHFMSRLPPAIQAMAGSAEALATPRGFLDAKFFVQSGLMLGIYAVLTGSGLLATDEEKGRLDLLVSYPISRAGLFWGRVAALGSSLFTIVFFAWLGLALSLFWSDLEMSAWELARGCLSLLALSMVFASLALLGSLLLPSRRIAASAAGLLLFGSFLMALLAPAIDKLRPLHALLPFHYYQGGKALETLDGISLAVLLTLVVVQLLAAWWLFERRDIRVMGEATLQPGRLARQLALSLCVYAAIVIPAAAWKGAHSPSQASPHELFQESLLPFNEDGPMP